MMESIWKNNWEILKNLSFLSFNVLEKHCKQDSLYPGRISNEMELFLASKFAMGGNSAFLYRVEKFEMSNF